MALMSAGLLIGACGGSTDASEGRTPSATPKSSSPSKSVSTSTIAAEAFVVLAADNKSVEIPWAEEVEYFIGSGSAGSPIPVNALPERLKSCPAGADEYEGRVCPVSPLATVAEVGKSGAKVVIENGAPETVGCSKVVPPAVSTGLRAISIRPPTDSRDCFSDFAVTLFENESGKIQVVQFSLSSP